MKKNIYIRRYWKEDDITLYIHFIGENAIRQIDVYQDKTIFLSENQPINNNSLLYDQKFSDIEWEQADFITEQEFDEMWKLKK